MCRREARSPRGGRILRISTGWWVRREKRGRRAYIAHFNWLVRSTEERSAQVEDYDRQEPNAGTRFRDVKVWENCSETDHRFTAMGTREFCEIASKLARTV